jgi:uncharacterized protein involved in high-affinity Fe2+ transport
MKSISKIVISVCFSLLATTVLAAETPIGQAVQKNGMQIGAVYLQSVVMEPAMPNDVTPTDIHLEADIHAVKGNQNGFAVGEWIPSLQISYHLSKVNSTWQQTGVLIPMVASDGPHYGANVKMNGPGKYHLTYHINPPSYNGFARHTDKETGVAKWWQGFDMSWDFTYLGTGKKGGY